MTAAAEQAPGLPVVVDLSNVQVMPSMAIGALVSMWKTIKTDERRFVLVGLQPRVRETLTICRLTTLFEIHETVDEALG